MHVLKAIAGLLASPLALGTLLGLAAVFCGVIGRRASRTALAIAAIAVVYLGSLGWVGALLITPLERSYVPLVDGPALQETHDVVVLGSGYEPGGHIPASAALDPDGLARIVEGISQMRRLSQARLIVSGGAPAGRAKPADGYARLAEQLGVSATSIVRLDRALDTAQEAHAIAALVGRTPFILVTSAYHMPRAMRLLQREGASPIPAPTGQRAEREIEPWEWVLPGSEGLARCERALHEYFGLMALAAGLH